MVAINHYTMKSDNSLLVLLLAILSLNICCSEGGNITYHLINPDCSVMAIQLYYLDAGVRNAPVQVVPEGIESVNGSSETMGCTSPLEDSGGVTVCRSQSYLVDGCSPDIDTSTSDWASQLVTVRRNERTSDIDVSHVLLTFGFETAVTLTGIDIDLFHCPEQRIGAPRIAVYINWEYNLAFNQGLHFLPLVQPSQSSCDSLSNVSVTGILLSPDAGFSFHTFHILVDLWSYPSIQWVYIGDVRFIGVDNGPTPTACLPLSPISSPTTTLTHSELSSLIIMPCFSYSSSSMYLTGEYNTLDFVVLYGHTLEES